MTLSIVLQFVVVLAAIWMGARYVRRRPRPVGCRRPAGADRGVRRQPDVAADRRDADHPGGDHGGVGDGRRRRHRLPGAHRRAHHPRQPEVRDHRRAAHDLDLHVRGRHRAHRLSAAAGDLRDRAPERHPARAADGGGDDRLAAGDHREPRGRRDRGDDRAVRREGHDAVGPAADPDDLRAGDAHRRARRGDRLDVRRQGPEGRSRIPGAAEGRAGPGAEGAPRPVRRSSPRPSSRPSSSSPASRWSCCSASSRRCASCPAPRRARDADRHRDRDAVGGGDHADDRPRSLVDEVPKTRRCAPAWSP